MITHFPIFGFSTFDLLAGLGNAEVGAAYKGIFAVSRERSLLREHLKGGDPEDPETFVSKLEALEKGIKEWPQFLADPRRPDWLGMLQRFGKEAEENDRFEEAAAVYRLLIRVEEKTRRTSFPMTWYYLGQALFGAAKFEEAAAAFRKSIELQPHPRAWCNLAKTLLKLQRLDEALKAIDASASAGGENFPQTHFVRGLILRAMGNLEAAEAAFRRAVNMEGEKYARSCVELGYTLSLQGRHDEGLAMLNRAIEVEPNMGFYYLERALVLVKMGQYEEALRDFQEGEKTHRLRPYESFSKAVALRNLDRVEEAIPILEELASSKTPHASALVELGICYRDRSQFEKSLVVLDRAVAMGPTHAKNWLERGATRKFSEDLEGALSDVEKALELEEGRFAYSFCEKSAILCFLKHFEEALAILLQAEEKFPEDDQVWFYKGMVLARLKRFDEALAVLVHASDLNPAEGKIFQEAAKVLIHLKRYEEAWAVIHHPSAISRKRYSGEASLIKVEILYHQKRYEEALHKLEQAQGVGPQQIEKWRLLILAAIRDNHAARRARGRARRKSRQDAAS